MNSYQFTDSARLSRTGSFTGDLVLEGAKKRIGLGTMQPFTRNLFLVAILLLGFMYVTPIWHINLAAPQYPEGIGMYIWLHTISGEKPNDLNNINNLNHYIGMKRIEPESIVELQYMPFIIAFFIALGLVAYLTKSKTLVYVWIGLFILVLVAGLVDFYLWEYDYGHNLNPHAAIKIPGMNYQPPVIGTKQLLNMRTTSLPYIGGIIALFSILIAAVSLYLDGRKSPKAKVV